MKSPKKILVRSPNWIGDQILAYPFFHYLRELYPSAHITVSCVPWVESVQFTHLVDDVITQTRPSQSGWGAKWQALEKTAEGLKQHGPWDLGICLPNSFSSAWLMFRSNVQTRRGYKTDARSLFLNQPVKWEKSSQLHRSEAYVRLLLNDSRFLKKSVKEFWGVPPVNDLDPGTPGIIPGFPAEKAWRKVKPLEPPKQTYWVLAPGATAESRRWPIERFAQLAKRVSLEKGWTGVIVGGAAESHLARLLTEDSSLKLLDWTEKGPVTSLWKVFQNAKFSICNDSGLAHLAALCGSPVQVVWGAGQPKITEPLGPGRVRIIFNPVECWPCESNFCNQLQDKRLDCLKGIFPDAVWEEIQTGLRI